MKIKNLHLLHLRNDEHFQFQTEFRDLIVQSKAQALKILEQFEVYQKLFAQEDEALHKIMRSPLTDDIEAADRRRDELFRGIVEANLSAGKHFSSEVRAAARRLQIVFNTYGNLVRKPLNEETSAITNLVQELKGACTDDVKAAGITDWTPMLETANTTYESLVKSRYDEKTKRTDLVLKEVRAQVDAAYRAIAGRIDALMVIEGGEPFANFIRRLNTIIDRANEILAHRKGKGPKKKTSRRTAGA